MGKIAGIVLFFGFILIGLNVLANPLSGSQTDFELKAHCDFQEVYSSYKADYIWFNILKNLFVRMEEFEETSARFQDKLTQAMDETLGACGHSDQRFYDIESFKGLELQHKQVVFELFGKIHKISFQEEEGVTSFVYQQYQASLKKFVTYLHSQRQLDSFLNHRILGREGKEGLNHHYFFLFSAQGKRLDRSAPIPLNINNEDYQSLRSIYGPNFIDKIVKDPRVVVGVVGTGVDYNHPMIAKHMLGRDEFENRIQGIIRLEDKILTFPYTHFDELKKDRAQIDSDKARVGFPAWMDQVLGTARPFDRLIPAIPGHDSRHETTIAGRILVNQGDIGLVSVRKGYVYSANEDLDEIFKNFHALGVKIINMSYAYNCSDGDGFAEDWRRVFTKYPDMIVVTAAGNDGKNVDLEAYCPAKYSKDYDQVVAVTAVGSNDRLAIYNNLSVNFGTSVNVAAYADGLLTLHPFGSTPLEEARGASSMATAETSRILVEALLKGLPLSGRNVKKHLEMGVIPNANLLGKVSIPGVLNQDRFEESFQD